MIFYSTLHRNVTVKGKLICVIFAIFLPSFYIRKDGVAVARMVDAEFEYTYEYQGNAPKLVHTPLTDKCYLTLTQVSHFVL